MQATLDRLLREHFEEIVDLGVHRTKREIPHYASISIQQLRPNVAAGFGSILADLETPPFERFCKVFGEIGYRRARQGFEVSDLYGVISLTEEILVQLVISHMENPNDQVPAILRTHSVCGTARTAIMESFRRANVEFLAEANAIIEQLSAPLLPIYPGILVLPLVGALNAERAQRILHSLLEGVVQNRARVAILDITGLPELNPELAGYLIRAAHATQLLGSKIIFTGVTPEVAKILTRLGLDLQGITTLINLQAGLERAFAEGGITIHKPQKRSPL